MCASGNPGFRYVEVQGSGFDAWATQHLVGNLVDAAGVPRISWNSIWVSPQGQLTLEVNLCADPFQNRPALAPGSYTVSVGLGNSTLASTGLSLNPAEAADQDQTSAPQRSVPASAPTPTPAPRAGIGSQQQPVPIGAPATLADGWQLGITGDTPNAYTTIQAQIPSAITPAPGRQDFMIAVQATYAGPGTGVFTDTRLALYSTLTHQTYDEVRNSCGAVPNPLVPNVVVSGTVVLGNVCFAVPSSEVGSLLLLDNQPSVADQVYFALP